MSHRGKKTLQHPWFKKNPSGDSLWSFHVAEVMEKYHGMPACWTEFLKRPLTQPKTYLQMPQTLFLLCVPHVMCTADSSSTLEISLSCSWFLESIEMLSSVSETGRHKLNSTGLERQRKQETIVNVGAVLPTPVNKSCHGKTGKEKRHHIISQKMWRDQIYFSVFSSFISFFLVLYFSKNLFKRYCLQCTFFFLSVCCCVQQ